jgi:hypothetical protein
MPVGSHLPRRGLAALALSLAILTAAPGTVTVARAADAGLRAPELEGGVGWINTDQPIRLKDLKGKVVLLDFWTLC